MRAEPPNGSGKALSAEQRWEARVRDGLDAFHADRVDEAYAAWRSAAAMIDHKTNRFRAARPGRPGVRRL